MGDTTGQAIPLDQVHNMALGTRLPKTDKPRHPLVRHGARDPRPMDRNAPGPDRALLHLTMKHTAQLPASLAARKYFIVEGLTDDVITLAANTLAATTDAWEVAVGHPTASKDTVQDTEDTLTPDLVNHLVTLTSPPEQHDRKTEGPKVTDWAACIDRPPDTTTVTLTCHQHTCWVAQWNATGTTDRVQTFTAGAKPATPLALGDHFKHSTHHTNHPRAHWLALKTAMHWTVDAPATDITLPETWLTLTRKLAAYVRKHGTAKAQRWMFPQTSHHQPTRTRKPASGYAAATGGTGTGIQHIRPRRTEAIPQTGTRTTPAQTEAPSRGSGRLGPSGQTAQTGAKSGPSATTT